MDIKNDIKSMKALDVEQYIDKSTKRSGIPEEAIKLYNKALEKANRDSEDIAIIELKKALSFDENFIEALTLLGYCYLMVDNQVEAKKYLLRATQLSEHGIRAYRLLYGMGVLDVPEAIVARNNLDKYNAGITASKNTKKKTKDTNNEDSQTPGVSIHSVGYAGKKRKSLVQTILIILATLFALLYLIFRN